MTLSEPTSPIVNPHAHRIVLAHGGGGQLTDELIRDVVRPLLGNEYLDALDDSAILPARPEALAFTTDSYVVQPLEFPGGDIGRLAVSGTVNDLAVCGARPLFISLGLILEEGLELTMLRSVLESAAEAARESGVKIVTGDTKVVARGQADGMYINTAGVGAVRDDCDLRFERIEPGDVVIVNGTIADHGLSVMLQRESNTAIRSELESDVAPLNDLIDRLHEATDGVVFMRDATRGGLAGVLSDLAEKSGYHLTIDETAIPIRQDTLYAAEMLGLDPLDVANEGKVVIVARREQANQVLDALRGHPLGKHAAVLGGFGETKNGLCELTTEVGGRRILQKPYGEELPRIC